ncbi:hypothetical protein [Virgibacillus oceani]|uniref:Uncharacterized protein n=1 Tax=Virgibacillus oceani TaxID=1479511 RepID=A0A917H4T8_9BACI|nr:hypothetical protein [Virgibacillus oceani]GGG67649.1 hypothetical protein GCM10011398_09280 [Virgibacillus oceani]
MWLLFEAIGWIIAGIGAYFIFDNDPNLFHYVILGAGIIIIAFTLPRNFRNKRKH